MTYSDGKLPAMRPLEVARELDSQGVEDDWESSDTLPTGAERATKWRGGAVRQEPQMTTPTQAGRRLAVRAAFALHLYTQPSTPFCR